MFELNSHIQNTHRFIKSAEDPNFTYTLGPVLIPDEPDHQGDVISSEEIAKAAHDFMENSQQPGLMHKVNLKTRDAVVVESYVMPSEVKIGKHAIPAGTWMLGMRVYNEKIRKAIREGDLKGYSIGGRGKREPVEDAS